MTFSPLEFILYGQVAYWMGVFFGRLGKCK